MTKNSKLERYNALLNFLAFFISGISVPRSYERKGTFMFLKDKFRRLGTPFVICVYIPLGQHGEKNVIVLLIVMIHVIALLVQIANQENHVNTVLDVRNVTHKFI